MPCITAAAASRGVLGTLGGFASRNRKERFNSGNTQLSLGLTVAAFGSLMAAERTGLLQKKPKKWVTCDTVANYYLSSLPLPPLSLSDHSRGSFSLNKVLMKKTLGRKS